MSNAWSASFGIAWGISWGSTGPAPQPAVVQQGSTIGGIGRWQIQIPRIPEKKVPIFTRNVENQDRADIDAIVQALFKGGWL